MEPILRPWPQLAGGQGGQLPPPDEPDHHQIEACGLRMGRPSFIFQSISKHQMPRNCAKRPLFPLCHRKGLRVPGKQRLTKYTSELDSKISARAFAAHSIAPPPKQKMLAMALKTRCLPAQVINFQCKQFQFRMRIWSKKLKQL